MSDEVSVKVVVGYRGSEITTIALDSAGNPRLAPRAARAAGKEALGVALDMLRAVTGDIDAPAGELG